MATSRPCGCEQAAIGFFVGVVIVIVGLIWREVPPAGLIDYVVCGGVPIATAVLGKLHGLRRAARA